MRRLDRTVKLPCDAKTFWEKFLDDAFTTRLYKEGLGFLEINIVEKSATKRRMRLVPNLKLPDAVGKLLGGAFGYEDVGNFDAGKGLLSFRSVPHSLGEKLLTTGTIHVVDGPDGKAIRKDEVKIESKVFGLGGLLEGTAEKELRSLWDREEKYLERELRPAG